MLLSRRYLAVHTIALQAVLTVFVAMGGLVAIGGLALTPLAFAGTPPEKQSPAEELPGEVRAILSKHCFDCHADGEESESALDLADYRRIAKGAKSGPVITPGSSAQSLLVQVLAERSEPHMPPKGQLAKEEVDTLAKWIDSLPAALPGPSITDADRDHWSFKPLVRPAVPEPSVAKAAASKDGPAHWARNDIDRFIWEKLAGKGLSPSPPADKFDYIRRVTFDLIGLPPTIEEVSAFVEDESADAHERLVDRLLASPHYGERWGRHWLDLARYADSSGFHSDLDRANAWRYRDYVIASLNEDKPYGQFLREQLAGDELAANDPAAIIATGFGRNGPSNEDNMGVEKEKYRLDELDDVVSTTGSVFLGLTIGCARCHDHKFDPVPQRDYYRLVAVFAGAERKDVPLTPATPVAEPPAEPAAEPEKITKKAPAGPMAMAMVESSSVPRPMRLYWRGDVKKPGPEVEPGVPEVLTREPLRFPTPAKDGKFTGRRSTLANWMASPENPLTWRVMANRLWQHHFGQGLVETSENFGRGGAKPSDPELLDWLASELAVDGRLKRLHRLIVLSATYRQSSAFDAVAIKVDPDNTLLWRMNKRRLEAEPLRDSILAVSGSLNTTMGGPGIKPRIRKELLAGSQRNKWPEVKTEGPRHWRRSVYIYVKRQLQMPIMELFDAPTSTSSCARREESLVPTQALVLMNDEFSREQAAHFARRVQAAAGESVDAQVSLAWRLAVARPASSDRIRQAAAFVEQQTALHLSQLAADGKAADQKGAQLAALTDLCQVIFNTNQFIYID